MAIRLEDREVLAPTLMLPSELNPCEGNIRSVHYNVCRVVFEQAGDYIALPADVLDQPILSVVGHACQNIVGSPDSYQRGQARRPGEQGRF
jgi:hypothetical protein